MRGVLVACAMLAQVVPLHAQIVPPYQPTRGQDGKDVVWCPTPPALVEAMLEKASVGPGDLLFDLGSGDGRIVIAAARRGARAIGIEYTPDLVTLSRHLAEEAGLDESTSFLQADLFEADFSRATVLTMYLMTDLNLRLRPKILRMRPGTRVVSNSFRMNDWEPDWVVTADSRTAYGWIVPARVAGTWTWHEEAGDAQLTLGQRFQRISGTLRVGGRKLALRRAMLTGDQLDFTVGSGASSAVVYSGRVDGPTITGLVMRLGGIPTDWVATLTTTGAR
ncbi:MAG: methyltransferase domain-containing protein [Acidobacteria bacterium]|nr:methyltransferase domain-containing protein [Acidobacteriota bacterium]